MSTPVGSGDLAGGQAAQAGAGSAGVVIDDAAVTPRCVVGLEPARELAISRITLGSLHNELAGAAAGGAL